MTAASTAVAEAVRQRARRFNRLHGGGRLLMLPNAWDAASARLIADAGFPAVATTSAGIAYAAGYPDLGRMPWAEMLPRIARIVASVAVPVSADIETGFGTSPEEVAATVRSVIEAGAVGCNIEDGTGDPRQPLFDSALVAERIAAAREVADACGLDFVINGRTDGFLAGGCGAETLAEAITRANRYLAAGARCAFVPAVSDRDLITRLVAEIAGPVNLLVNADSPPLAELQALGVARATTGGSLARAAFGFVRGALTELRERGTFGYAVNALTAAELDRLSTSLDP
ncbi:MAG: isocitrate lyase/phosphoenolpyruvate mutase family protein [Candidatus Hydrogenedens sp.]|nr:isocitrate lyase/phosphoenolpyruvate mutase family protein [Candidatus Hydrogenedens sp.]